MVGFSRQIVISIIYNKRYEEIINVYNCFCDDWHGDYIVQYGYRSFGYSSSDNMSEEYWENLRAYKARNDHEVFFGWFGDGQLTLLI